ncbi:diguanylate cyclase [uncultured Shewanella sp.]|uniref:diguanylate cyclase domain-containing protein n=1 Tax=uncultured Shewanella sp. TaxID=173975 RepID=UPI00262800AF|nr:diguanylate cyclase [uncultured Shewanella sp.]
MKVTLRLKILLIVSLMLTSVILLSFVTLKEIQVETNSQLYLVSDIEYKIDMLSSKLWLLQEYHDQDALEQTRIAHEELKRLLQQALFSQRNKNVIAANLKRMNDNIGVLLNLSQQDLESQVSHGITSPSGMLSARYNMTLQSMNEDLWKLEKLAIQDSELSQRKILASVILLMVVGSAVVLTLTLLTLKTFNTNLNALTIGIKDLAKGNLNSRIEVKDTDELSVLAEQFNLMKRSLEETTVKKDQLQLEVERQTKELQHQREEFEHLANHDSLTKLYSRSAFEEQMNTALARCSRTKQSAALLFIDLDRFKAINDCHGHAAGDLVLVEVAEKLLQTVRSSDIIARIGGDEFIIWLEPIENATQVMTVIRKLTEQFALPIQYEDISLLVNASIGVSFFPIDATELSSLLKVADENMYKAKEVDGTTFQFTDKATRGLTNIKMA